MTDTVESGGTRWRRPGRRTTWAVVGVLLLCLLAAVPAGVHRWTHPDLLPDAGGDRSSLEPQPVADAAVAFAITSPVARGRATILTWHGARAVLATNTAHAKVAFSTCDTVLRLQPDVGPLLGSVRDLAQFCSAVHHLTDGTHLSYPNPHQIVLLTLTPTRAGAVHLTGVDVRYALGADHLFQHGTDHVALDARLVAR